MMENQREATEQVTAVADVAIDDAVVSGSGDAVLGAGSTSSNDASHPLDVHTSDGAADVEGHDPKRSRTTVGVRAGQLEGDESLDDGDGGIVLAGADGDNVVSELGRLFTVQTWEELVPNEQLLNSKSWQELGTQVTAAKGRKKLTILKEQEAFVVVT